MPDRDADVGPQSSLGAAVRARQVARHKRELMHPRGTHRPGYRRRRGAGSQRTLTVVAVVLVALVLLGLATGYPMGGGIPLLLGVAVVLVLVRVMQRRSTA